MIKLPGISGIIIFRARTQAAVKKLLIALAFAAVCFAPLEAICRDKPVPTGPQTDGSFRKVVIDPLEDTDFIGKLSELLREPMELAVAKDGRVFYAERAGQIKMWKPNTRVHTIIGKVMVENYHNTKMEDGLLGIILDPKFESNGWLYLYYSPHEMRTNDSGTLVGENILSRFTLKGDELDLGSEKVLLHVDAQRSQCCHSGGGLAFDAQGNLYVSTGDNTNPFYSDGFSPMDERSGHESWDAQRTSANANDLRGKILRVKPQDDGTAKIPEGNLFKPGTPGTRPEIYVMGCRNPFRITVDPRNGYLYWGDVGPDAEAFLERRGPAGLDEINQAVKPGNFGWPYFTGDNRAFWAYDFKTKVSAAKFDPTKPINNSTNNTGIKELPPAMPSFISYANVPSVRFPEVNGSGGRAAMVGPVYYYDETLKSEHKLPREFDHTLFIFDWAREWIIAVHLNAMERIEKMERICPNMTFKRPIEMKLGPDGCLYMIEWGSGWYDNLDSQVERIEYIGQSK